MRRRLPMANLPNPTRGATFLPQPAWPKRSDRVGRVPERVKGKSRGNRAIRIVRLNHTGTSQSMPSPDQQTAVEVYRAVLARLGPRLGASFASTYLRDREDPDLLRLECALNWPQSSARFLNEIRIREGRGPTGSAVASGTVVHVEDVFRDPGLQDWWEPARELGFVSVVAVPLVLEGRTVGAVTFYFEERRPAPGDPNGLMEVVAREIDGASVEHQDSVRRTRSGPGP
jgi:hypothetical protein